MYGSTRHKLYPNLISLGKSGKQNVRITVFVFRRAPSLLTLIRLASITLQFSRLFTISASSQSPSASQRTTPLLEFRDRCGVTETGNSPMFLALRRSLLCFSQETSASRSPDLSLFTFAISVPTMPLIPFWTAKGDMFLIELPLSVPFIKRKCGQISGRVSLSESVSDRSVLVLLGVLEAM